MCTYLVALTVIKAFLSVQTVYIELKVVLLHGSESLGRRSIETFRINALEVSLLVTFHSLYSQPRLKLMIPFKLVLIIELLHVFVTPDFHSWFSYLVEWDKLYLVRFPAGTHEGLSCLNTAMTSCVLAFDVFVIVVILLDSLTAQS